MTTLTQAQADNLYSFQVKDEMVFQASSRNSYLQHLWEYQGAGMQLLDEVIGDEEVLHLKTNNTALGNALYAFYNPTTKPAWFNGRLLVSKNFVVDTLVKIPDVTTLGIYHQIQLTNAWTGVPPTNRIILSYHNAVAPTWTFHIDDNTGNVFSDVTTVPVTTNMTWFRFEAIAGVSISAYQSPDGATWSLISQFTTPASFPTNAMAFMIYQSITIAGASPATYIYKVRAIQDW